MIDIEKLSARARTTLMTISIIGALVLLTGAGLTAAVMNRESQKPDGDWIAGIGPASGAIILAGIGLLLTCTPPGHPASRHRPPPPHQRRAPSQ